MKDRLENYTIEQLEKHLTEKKLQKKKDETPKPQENPDFTYVKEATANYIKELNLPYEERRNIDEYEILIAEGVLKAIYGSDVYDWINEQLDTEDD